MNKSHAHVSLNIAGRNFKLAAPEAEMARLVQAAQRLEAVCARLAPTLSRSDPERLLLLAALELASLPDNKDRDDPSWKARVQGLRERVEQALAASRS